MMNGYFSGGSWMWGMGGGGILMLVVVVLVIAALARYVFSGRGK